VLSRELEPVEAEVLAQCAAELLELLGESDEVSDDPLKTLVGLPPGDVQMPDDPALARLFRTRTAMMRRRRRSSALLTESDLRPRSGSPRQKALVQLQPLLATGGKRCWTATRSMPGWLLNDIRLVLGTRLEISETRTTRISIRRTALAGHADLQLARLAAESLLACVDPRSQGERPAQ